jgi:hypothetical protein
MREFQIVHQALHENSPELHKKRLDTLMTAVQALQQSDTLTLTSLGRHIDNDTLVKHSIKQMDRPLNNYHLCSQPDADRTH